MQGGGREREREFSSELLMRAENAHGTALDLILAL